MINMNVSVKQRVWDEIRIVRLVNKVGKYKCDIDIILDKKYINVKNIKTMMEFLDEISMYKSFDISINGEEEEEAANVVKEYFEN